MPTSTTCAHCHQGNPTTAHWCRACGHAAHLARLACDCARCQPPAARCPLCERTVPLVDDPLFSAQLCADCTQARCASWQRSEARRGPTLEELDGAVPGC